MRGETLNMSEVLTLIIFTEVLPILLKNSQRFTGRVVRHAIVRSRI